ncbi:hypothetical protein D1BOALGB6SA_5427 [Olavius sp. associated proteobacterium Delta 1]|nr:hypothetical protein D1BOALGB6SA_5427 [Olavius sp. associated proteobacterium Delta 1]
MWAEADTQFSIFDSSASEKQLPIFPGAALPHAGICGGAVG